jgi:DNA-binding IclR family transcriptional regulator
MVQAVVRASKILKLVAESSDGLRLYELADLMGLKRTTVFNLADTLVEEELLTRDQDTRYLIGPAVGKLYRSGGEKRLYQNLEIELTNFYRKFPEATLVLTELGNNDIRALLYMPRDCDGKPQYPADMTLNPYFTVCGLIFFAFAPDDDLGGLRVRHPFEFRGLEGWGSFERFQEAVRLTRDNGYAESPMTPEGEIKFGIPVFSASGLLRWAITFSVYDLELWLPRRDELLNDLLELAGKIGA